MPVEIDGARALGGAGYFGNLAAFPIHDFVKGGDAFLSRRGRVPHLSAFEIDAGLFSLRSGELQRGGRSAHAFQLDDIGEVQIAERSLKFFAVRLARRRKERLDEIDEVGMREWFFEKMNRAEAGGLFAVRGKVNAGQDNGARIGMAGAQIVEEILAQIGNGIDVENEKVRPIIHDEALGLFEIAGKIDLGGRARLPGGPREFSKRGPVRARAQGCARLVRKNSEDASVSYRSRFKVWGTAADTSSREPCPRLEMPASRQMKSIFRTEQSPCLLSAETARVPSRLSVIGLPGPAGRQDSACVDTRCYTMPRIVDARR